MIKTTGNERIDTATAEIAVALRNSAISPGSAQYYYDEAMRLRNEIITGVLETVQDIREGK